MFQKITTLCCSGPRCPIVTKLNDTDYQIVDDYGNTTTTNSTGLTELAAIGARHQPTTTVRFHNVQMLAEQARLATTAI